MIGLDILQEKCRLEIDDYGKDKQLQKNIRRYNDTLSDYMARNQISALILFGKYYLKEGYAVDIRKNIENLQQLSELNALRKQIEELRLSVEKQSGMAFNPKAQYHGYDTSKKFIPARRPAMFKTRLG